MRNIIYAVFVIPIIQIALGKLNQSKKRERFKGVIYLSGSYQSLCIICDIILTVLAIFLSLRFGIKESWSICVLIAIMILIIEIIRLCFKRYKIIVSDQGLEITPFVGRKRKITYNEIECIEQTVSRDLKIIVKGKKVGLVDASAVGYKEFSKLMQEKGYLEE